MVLARSALLVALASPGCSGPPARGPLDPDPPGPLACHVIPCRSFEEERATQCGKPGTQVRVGTLAGFTVLTAETDPTSVVFTSFKFYFDASGRLVGRSSFINEWGRRSLEGRAPLGVEADVRSACGG